MKHIATLIFSVLTLALVSCSGQPSIEDELRNAEAAIAVGNIKTASSVAAHITGSDNISRLSSSQFARLSLIYMQLADSIDREDNVGQAADFYRRAYMADSDSATAFYTGLDAEKMQYANMLRSLASPRDTANISSFYDTTDTIL